MATLVAFTDPDEYAKCIVPLLETNEVENSLFLTALESIQSDPNPRPAVMLQFREGEETIAAAFYRDRFLIVTRGLEEAAANPLATYLHNENVELPGVIGPSSSTEPFAAAWSRIRGCEAELMMDQGLYWLKALDWPAPIPGRMRAMRMDDIPLVAQWILDFQREAVPHDAETLEGAWKKAEARSHHNMTFIWETEGVPVSMAALARPTRHGITLTAAYTPPEYRGRGYATALVAFVTDEGLKRGKEFCSLYTDLANRTSNSIYPKIGYRLFSYSRLYLFR
jgi:uncharacterized protein